jgi:hypothetical protein
MAFAHSVHVIFVPYLEPRLTVISLNNKDPCSKTVEYLGEDLNLKPPYPPFPNGELQMVTP